MFIIYFREILSTRENKKISFYAKNFAALARNQTCAKIPKRSKIQDPLDPRSGIQVDLGSSNSGFVEGSRGSWIQHFIFCEILWILDPALQILREILWILDPALHILREILWILDPAFNFFEGSCRFLLIL